MSGIGISSYFTLSLDPSDHFCQILFYYSLERLIEANRKSIRAWRLIRLESPNRSSDFLLINFLIQADIHFLGDSIGQILKKISVVLFSFFFS